MTPEKQTRLRVTKAYRGRERSRKNEDSGCGTTAFTRWGDRRARWKPALFL